MAAEKTTMPTDTLLAALEEAGGDISIDLPEYDWDEIVKHNKPRYLWIVVGGNIYNVGEFMYHHPGGADV